MRRSVFLPFFGLFLLFDFSSAYIEALGANVDLSEDVHHLQVAFACDKGADYHNQFMDRNGNWVSDLESKAHCLEQSDEILKYCQQVYPHADVTNIVESIHTHVIDNWCRMDAGGCVKSFTVRPYRCLTGKFQSDALLVPEQCQFDHIHNSSMCAGFYSWNSTASRSCGQHNATLRSFAMLLPCGTDMFTGVEFVCCPGESGSGGGGEVTTTPATTTTTTTVSTETPSLGVSLEQAAGGKVARDPYFTRFDARGEHDAFDAARRRLDRRHKKQVATVMDDWTRLELKYEQIRRKDPQRAAKYRQRMNDRFARAMSSVKQQAAAERRQLLTVHQQRLIEHINQRKNTSLVCLVTALNERPPHQQRVRRCLEHLLRALYSDRHHTLAHYNHLLVSEPAAAAAVQLRAATIAHLADVDRMVNESLAMLERYPQMSAAILVDIDQLLVKLRQRDTLPYELVPSTITSTTTTSSSTTTTSSASATEATPDPRQQIVDAETVAIQQKIAHHQHQQRIDNNNKNNDGGDGAEAGAAVASSGPSLSYLRQPLSQLRRSVSQHWLLAAGCALTLVAALALAVFTMRHRHTRHYRHRHTRFGKADCMLGGSGGGGFVPVAQSEPLPVHRPRPRQQQQQLGADQRHIALLRANGYENPTYKYFESK